MKLNADTPTRSIIINGYEFTVPAPYAAGHVLEENEANVLNQTLSENLRNNFASTVKAAKEQAGEGEVDLSALQSELNEYVAEYEFGVRRTGSGTGAPRLEPRERIALNLAKEKVKAAIRAKGQKPTDYAAEAITELASKLVQKDPTFYAEADRQLKVQQKVAAAEIDLSDLGDLVAKEPTADSAAA